MEFALTPQEIIEEVNRFLEPDITVVPDGTLMKSKNTVGRFIYTYHNDSDHTFHLESCSIDIEDQVMHHDIFSRFCLMHEIGHYSELKLILNPDIKFEDIQFGNLSLFFGSNNLPIRELESVHNKIIPHMFKDNPAHFICVVPEEEEQYRHGCHKLTFNFQPAGSGINDPAEVIANFVSSLWCAPELTIKWCPTLTNYFMNNLISGKYGTLLKNLFAYLF